MHKQQMRELRAVSELHEGWSSRGSQPSNQSVCSAACELHLKLLHKAQGSSSADKSDCLAKRDYNVICKFIEDHNQKLISLPKKKLKVSELMQNKDKYLVMRESVRESQGTLVKSNGSQLPNTPIQWDIHSVGSKMKVSRENHTVEIGETSEGRYQTAVCTTGFESGVICWELEVGEKKSGDARLGICKTKVLNNDECFTNFAIGFAISSDGNFRSGPNLKSNHN